MSLSCLHSLSIVWPTKCYSALLSVCMCHSSGHLPVQISKNDTLFRNQKLIAELWLARVYCALLSVTMCHSGRHCHCMSPRMTQSYAILFWLQNFDRQECIVHSCRSQCIIPGDIVTACLPEWDNLLQSECDCKTLTDKSVLCTLVGLHVSFRETLSLHVSQNETIFRIHNLNAEVWPTRVHNTLLSI